MRRCGEMRKKSRLTMVSSVVFAVCAIVVFTLVESKHIDPYHDHDHDHDHDQDHDEQYVSSVRQRIDPITSNVYYLEDYCRLPTRDELLEERYRHRRSADEEAQDYEDNDDDDDDDDHNANHHHRLENFADGIEDTVKYYMKKGYRQLKSQLKRERKWHEKMWKQIYLDPIEQPSVVVRLWRQRHNAMTQAKQAVREAIDPQQPIRCKMLLRLQHNVLPRNISLQMADGVHSTPLSAIQDSLLNSFHNATLGAVVNFLKLNQKPWLNSYRLRIVTSDPNMTQYWIQGQKLTTSNHRNNGTTRSVPVALDVITNPQIHPQPLMKQELELLQQDSGKWLLIELHTLKMGFEQAIASSQTAHNSSETKSQKSNDNFEADSESMPIVRDETQLVINLYTKSIKEKKDSPLASSSNMAVMNESAPAKEEGNGNMVQQRLVKVAAASSSTGVDSNHTNHEESQNEYIDQSDTCPPGTFDCAGDGQQCIPNSLRCNGEDNCGNRFDELFNCGTVNMFYILGADHHRHRSSQSDFYLSSNGFWIAVRVLILLFLICLLLYTTTLLCRCCCDRRSYALIDGSSPLVYHLRSSGGGRRSGTCSSSSGSSSQSEPLLASYGPTAGRVMKMAPSAPSAHQASAPRFHSSPPPSYFGNQSDNQKSNVNEYIYVNNNYGQPQGSTTVNTSVRPARDNIYQGGTIEQDGASAPPQFLSAGDQYPAPLPLYPDIPNYGGVEKR